MTDKTDALVALIRAGKKLRNSVVETRGVAAMDAHDEAIRAAEQALAEQPTGAVGDAVGCPTCGAPCSERRIVDGPHSSHYEYTYTPPAASVDVEAVAVPRNPSQDWLDKVANLLGIDSAEMDNIHAAILSATPQPAEGDGASPTTVRFIDGGIVQMDRADYDKLTRPSAAAAVPDAWEAIVEACVITEAVTPVESDPRGTLNRLIDYHVQMNVAARDAEIARLRERVERLEAALGEMFDTLEDRRG